MNKMVYNVFDITSEEFDIDGISYRRTYHKSNFNHIKDITVWYKIISEGLVVVSDYDLLEIFYQRNNNINIVLDERLV